MFGSSDLENLQQVCKTKDMEIADLNRQLSSVKDQHERTTPAEQRIAELETLTERLDNQVGDTVTLCRPYLCTSRVENAGDSICLYIEEL